MKCVFVHWNIWEVNNNSFCLDWETSSLETLQFFLDIFLQSDNLRYPWLLSTFTVKSELLQLKLELFKTHRNQWQGICDHLIKSIQIRKSISKKTVKKRANEKPHRKRPSSHFRRCSAAAQSRTDLRWRTQTLAIRTGYFDQRLMVRRIVSTDRPSDNPDNFVHRSRRHNLGVYHTYQTWTREHNHRLQCCYLKQLCAVGRPPPFLDALSISAVVLEVGALQNVGEWFEVPKKHRRKFDYISYNHIYKTTYIIWYDMMYQSARETEEKAAPCNLVHPRHPRSQPCHRTWAGRVS